MRRSIRAALLTATALVAGLALAPPAGATVSGPVINSDFPDPSVLHVGSTYYAYATNGGGKNIPVATSTDFAAWTKTSIDALPTLGAWASPGKTWAPDVIDRGDGTYVMYYTARNDAQNTQCIGTATSTSPTGPFSAAASPLACETAGGGAIDPAGFQDTDGTRYVVYKVDGNNLAPGGNCGNPNGTKSTPIRLLRMAADGVTPVGSATTILDRGQYDGPLIEAPSLIKHDGVYTVFFSSNCFNTDLYDISYATATSVAGPYTKASQPLLTSHGDLHGPGGADPLPDGSRMVFHGSLGSAGRGMYTATLTWNGRVVSV